MTTHDDGEGPVERHVRPSAWIGVGCVTGTPVFALDDEPRSDACAPWGPVYDEATMRAAIAAAWGAGYWHKGYTYDSAYADAQAEALADELLGKWA